MLGCKGQLTDLHEERLAKLLEMLQEWRKVGLLFDLEFGEMLHGGLQLHDVRLDAVGTLDLLRAQMFQLFNEVLDPLLVQLLSLLILVHQVLR